MSEVKKFTEQDLKDWRAYERVRKGGRYNMFDFVVRDIARRFFHFFAEPD